MLAQFYPPIVGGVEQHVSSLSAALAARGHSVAVATLWHKGLPEFEMDGAVRIYRMRGTLPRFTALFTTERQHAPPFPDPEVTLALRRILTQVQPEIVHAHNWIVYSYLPLKTRRGAKLVLTLHGCELACVQMRMMERDAHLCTGPAARKCWQCAAHHYGSAKGTLTWFSHRTLNGYVRSRVDLFLPVSHAIAAANQLTDARALVRVVPNFAPDDVAAISDDRDPRLAQLPPAGFILQVGDLLYDKGIDILLQAYAGLPSAPPLVLIGRRLGRSLANLPANVIVLESLPHNLVMQAWRRSGFGTVPSLCLDAFPTVTIEAMASGKPVIGSRIGGIQDQIVDGETGLLVPPGDVDALRKALARLIAEPALRERMGSAARRKAVEFQASTVVTQIEHLYQELIANHS